MKQIYSEEEVKTLLKTLFKEKSRLKELEKKLEEGKSAIEPTNLKEKLERAKEAFQKLISELKGAKETIVKLEKEKELLVKAQEGRFYDEEKNKLVERLSETLIQLQTQAEISRKQKEEILTLRKEKAVFEEEKKTAFLELEQMKKNTEKLYHAFSIVKESLNP